MNGSSSATPGSSDPNNIITAPEMKPGADLKRSAVRGWTANMVAQAIKFVLTTTGTVIIARILSPSDYGLVAMVTSFVGFVSLFKDLGLSQATIQRATISQDEISGLFWFNVVSGLVLMVIIAGCAPLVSKLYGQPELTMIMIAYAAMAPISSLGSQHRALLQRAMRYRSLAIRDILGLSTGVSAGVLSAVNDMGYWSLVVMQATSDAVSTITLWFQSRWRPDYPQWSNKLKPLLRFGGAVTASNILAFTSKGLDSMLLGYFFGPAQLGTYNRAQHTLSRPLRQVIPPMMSVVGSTFARLSSDAPRFASAAALLSFIIPAASGLLVLIVVVCGEWIVLIMLGPQWGEVIPIVRVLALFAFVEPVASFYGALLVARGLPGKVVRWRLWSAPMIVVSMLAGLPWGIFGVALAISSSGLLIRTPIFLAYASINLKLPTSRVFVSMAYPALCLATSIAVLLFAHIVFGNPKNPIASLVLYSSASAALYGGLLLLLPASRQRLQQARSLLRSGYGTANIAAKRPDADAMSGTSGA